MRITQFILLATLITLIGCSEHVPNKHEQLYLNTADSLKLYQDLSYLRKELKANQKAQDFLELDFSDFKKKHNLTNSEMKVLEETMQGHINVAKTIDLVHTHH
jgi:hypothetical protein